MVRTQVQLTEIQMKSKARSMLCAQTKETNGAR